MEVAKIISDILSIITISMCLFLKVPQIMSIRKLKSSKGINVLSLMMELTSYTVTATYNYVNGYALLSYMEYPIILFQEYILIYLVFYYQDLIGKKTVICTFTYIALVLGFIKGILPASLILIMVPLCTPISLSSKAIQLWEIIKNKNADSVSVSTWVISASTNASRIYTIIMDSADMILLANFSLSTLLSSLIAISAYYLQKPKKVRKD